MKPLRKISQKTKKSLDDGSVKGLILSNDYSTAGEGVAIQNIVNGISTWVICGGGCCPHAMKVSAKRGKIYWETAEEAMEEVLSFCRGEFKKEEILLCSVNSFYLLESGVVFLEDRLCSFNQKKLGHIIPYADMENVCLDGNSVTIKVSNGQKQSCLVAMTGNTAGACITYSRTFKADWNSNESFYCKFS